MRAICGTSSDSQTGSAEGDVAVHPHPLHLIENPNHPRGIDGTTGMTRISGQAIEYATTGGVAGTAGLAGTAAGDGVDACGGSAGWAGIAPWGGSGAGVQTTTGGAAAASGDRGAGGVSHVDE